MSPEYTDFIITSKAVHTCKYACCLSIKGHFLCPVQFLESDTYTLQKEKNQSGFLKMALRSCAWKLVGHSLIDTLVIINIFKVASGSGTWKQVGHSRVKTLSIIYIFKVASRSGTWKKVR